MSHVQLVPAAERRLPDLAPEGAGRQRLAAAAALVLDDTPLPEVDHLADGTNAGQLTEQPFEQRAPAASEAAEIDDPGQSLGCDVPHVARSCLDHRPRAARHAGQTTDRKWCPVWNLPPGNLPLVLMPL